MLLLILFYLFFYFLACCFHSLHPYNVFIEYVYTARKCAKSVELWVVCWQFKALAGQSRNAFCCLNLNWKHFFFFLIFSTSIIIETRFIDTINFRLNFFSNSFRKWKATKYYRTNCVFIKVDNNSEVNNSWNLFLSRNLFCMFLKIMPRKGAKKYKTKYILKDIWLKAEHEKKKHKTFESMKIMKKIILKLKWNKMRRERERANGRIKYINFNSRNMANVKRSCLEHND